MNKIKKVVIPVAGKGTRFLPITKTISKTLLPIVDTPVIQYLLEESVASGIKEALIIIGYNQNDVINYFNTESTYVQKLNKDYEEIKYIKKLKNQIRISYVFQEEAKGLGDAVKHAKAFVGQDDFALILGDNMIYGSRLERLLKAASSLKEGGVIFGYKVADPTSYGVVEIDDEGNAISIEEKPENPKSDLAVPGIYFYDNEVVEIAKNIKPSARGEIEITDVNEVYMKKGKLKVIPLGTGYAWFDTGTADRLADASDFVKAIELRQGTQIACLEEYAYKNGWITKDIVMKHVEKYKKTEYGKYLKRVIEEKPNAYKNIFDGALFKD